MKKAKKQKKEHDDILDSPYFKTPEDRAERWERMRKRCEMKR